MSDNQPCGFPRSGDALIVVDMQVDFLAGGALAVPGAENRLPIIQQLITRFHERGCPVVASRDWHPSNHCSFHHQGGRWPAHCIQGTAGAALASGLQLPPDVILISKGEQPDREAFSAFQDTELAQRLRHLGVQRLFLCGVALEYCVQATAHDALSAGWEVVLLTDAVQAIEDRAGRAAVGQLLERGASVHGRALWEESSAVAPALLTDLYQLTMLQGYFVQGMTETAVFEFFSRKLPKGRNFFVAAGLEQALDYLTNLRFTAAELAWLASQGFRDDFLEYLAEFRFTGDVDALPEGTVFFPHEPLVRVTAPLPQAQLVESRLINLFHFQTLIASKAARSVLAAPDKLLVDFGLRRAHGAEAGLLAARAAYLAGYSGTATVAAGEQFGIPLYGTMAHSFIQAHDDELTAFEHFARANPDRVVLLIDTYDTERGAEKVVELSRRLQGTGIRIQGVRLDSGDLAEHARRVRRILDAGGLHEVTIFASGNLDEGKLRELLAAGAPIDGFGVGSRLDVSADAPYLDCAYKLQEYAGRPRRKRSEGKATWPGRKQVYRTLAQGMLTGDTVSLESDPQPGTPLLEPCLRGGKRLTPPPTLEQVRARAAQNLAQLPAALRQLDDAPPYPVRISDSLERLACQVDEDLRRAGGR
ncbi:MAG: nicotinate phosphoribosyltransferase [Pirellulales bacterium]